MLLRNTLLLALSLCLGTLPACAQESDSGSPSSSSTGSAPPPPAGLPADYSPGGTVTTGTNGQPLLPEGNPMSGLFTPQPQYSTPQSQANPTSAIPAGESNPLGKLFNNNAPATVAPTGTNNVLQGFLTGQPQFATPQTLKNPDPQAGFALPGYGQAKLEDLQKAGINFKLPGSDDKQNEPEKAGGDSPEKAITAGATAPDAQKVSDKETKDKDGKVIAKDKDAKDKDGKDKTADKDSKDKTADKDSKEPKDKNATADGKGADAKDGDKKADGDKTGDKKADGDKTDDKKADGKDDKDKDAKAAEKPKDLGPYNPLREAVFFMNAGQSQQALEVLAKVLKANPANAEAHYLCAVVFVSMRDYKMAGDEYSLVLRLVPTSPLAQLALDGLKKIGVAPKMSSVMPKTLPPLRR